MNQAYAHHIGILTVLLMIRWGIHIFTRYSFKKVIFFPKHIISFLSIENSRNIAKENVKLFTDDM